MKKIVYNNCHMLQSSDQLNNTLSKSSKRKFEIASPHKSPLKKVAQINWEACFICQSEENNFPLVSPCKSPQYDSDPSKSSYYKVSRKFAKFFKYNDLLPTVLQKHLENYKTDQDLVSQFDNKKQYFIRLV